MELLTTTAREIDKASVTETTTPVLDGKMETPTTSPMKPGEYWIRPNLMAKPMPLQPHGWRRFWHTLIQKLFGGTDGPSYQVIPSIVMSCPYCGCAIITSLAHKVVSRNPLTVDRPIACPYSNPTHSFTIKDGKIMSA